jgi:4-diphosphocytidyl-2C-methyl-D-erythritol kinase
LAQPTRQQPPVNDTLTIGQHFVDLSGSGSGVIRMAKKSKKNKKGKKGKKK